MVTKVYVLYENETWLEPLREAFEKHQLAFEPIFVNDLNIDLEQQPPAGIYLNRLSASASTRGHERSLVSGRRFLAWLEHWGCQVVNGSRAIELEMSKFNQHLALMRHGIKTPRSLFITGEERSLQEAAVEFGFPFIYKYDCGGKGLGVQLIEDDAQWDRFLKQQSWQQAPDGRHILQQYIRAAQPFITRCEFIGGRFHYAIRADTSSGFELCPAEGCVVDRCQLGEAEAETSIFSLAPQPPQFLIDRYMTMLAAEGVDIAGIEFIEDTDGQLYTYDINCNTNYSPFVEKTASVEPGLDRLARYLIDRLREEES